MASFPSTLLTVPVVALPGQLSDSGDHDLISRFVGGASTIAPGLLAIWFAGDADNKVRAPTLTGQVSGANVMGITKYEETAPNNPFAVGDGVTLLKRGRIWVNVEEAVTPASPVFVRFAAGTFAVLGAFRASADTATAVACPGLKFCGSQAVVGGLVELEVNFP